MLQHEFVSAAAIAASVLFILSLGGLSNQEKAKRAVWYGIGDGDRGGVHRTRPRRRWARLADSTDVDRRAGRRLAGGRVEMTEMPQLVAALHSVVGLAAVFIGFNAEMERARVVATRVAGIDVEGFSAFAATLAHKTRWSSPSCRSKWYWACLSAR